MFGLSENYQKLWKAIIRPPRAQYTEDDLKFVPAGQNKLRVKRTPVQLTNKRGFKIVGSHYQPQIRPCKMLPCMIYLHGNSSSQVQGKQNIKDVLCHDVSLFTFDFAGCGKSQGQYISLGFHQRQDVDVVFNYLRSLGTVSSIGIWGRSMGAVTALMYSDRNHQIGCLILDSPFSNLQTLCKQLAKRYMSNLSAFSGIALTILSKTIKQKNNFDIEQINPIGNVSKAFIPALFIAAKDDDFILPHHTDQLYEKYSGDKSKLLVEGDHNSRRRSSVLQKISNFIYFGLCVKDLVQRDEAYIKQQQEKLNIEVKKQKPVAGKIQMKKKEQLDDYQVFEQQDELSKALQLSLSIYQKQKNKHLNEKKQ